MRNWLTTSLVCAVSAAGIFGLTTSSRGDVLYSDPLSAPGTTSNAAFSSTAGGNGLTGLGDDYSTAYPSLLLTGLTFTGGTNSADPTANVDIDFYTTAGVLAAVLQPSASEVVGYQASHTLASSDFGSGITIPGSGYFIFAPYDSTNTRSNFYLASGSSAATVGTTDGNKYQTNDSGVISSAGTYHPYVNVELDGTAVPEPASLGLVGTSGLLLLRRRRTA